MNSKTESADERYMREAIELARQGVLSGHGGPFGALVVAQGEIIGRGWNQVVRNNDPTAHAEILAIRQACQTVGQFHLRGATLYSSCEPCPMCLSAAYWARIETLVFAANAEDASAIGFNDQQIKAELQRPVTAGSLKVRQLYRAESLAVFQQWMDSQQRVGY